jgi:lysophospholipase L1-like esterase
VARRRRWAFLLLALLGGSVVALLAVELAFRLFWPLPPWFAELQQAGIYVATADGDVALQPGYRGTLQVDTLTTIAVNRIGLRGDDVPVKAVGEHRILVLGDSMVFGYGVEGDETLPAALARAVASAGRPSTVGNAGVPGYGSKHSAAQQRRLDASFAPDAFVFCGCLGNDTMDDLTPQRTVYAGLMLQGAWARLAQVSWRGRLVYRSRAAMWFESWLLTNHPDRSLLRLVPPDLEEAAALVGIPAGKTFAGLFLDVAADDASWPPGCAPVLPRVLDVLRASLRRMQQQAAGRPLLFVVLPTSLQVIETKRVANLRKLEFEPAAFVRGRAQARWLAVAAELGIAAADATSVLAAAPDPDAFFLSDGVHYNAAGCAVVAEFVAEQLVPLLQR